MIFQVQKCVTGAIASIFLLTSPAFADAGSAGSAVGSGASTGSSAGTVIGGGGSGGAAGSSVGTGAKEFTPPDDIGGPNRTEPVGTRAQEDECICTCTDNRAGCG